ncbi:MAG: hypothetical protein KJ852_03065 [Gammaproteobacteria bacterium]|nr:hypothetical protein [Gammaproteobacteria bacterium]MBU0787564.1 hypothetical protein [Gammaproteobacteria bacterium]MBU0814966.1 hypothetical protein [Gammaproteobacteria bacterium]MBU1785926.1 hypothetical protein [Gammaproteobacteria bacterium]
MAAAAVREDVVQAAQSAVARQLALAQRGRSMLYPFIGRSKQFKVWRHYPANDAVDVTGSWQFYFHAHEAEAGSARHPLERGHIHLFRRGVQGQLSHLAGLSLDAQGLPLNWFATNQWVTGERWLAARTLAQGLQDVELKLRGPLAGVALWLADLVRFYASPLREMLQARDHAFARYCTRQRLNRSQAWADRRVAVWSSLPVHWPQDAIKLQGQVSSQYT